MDSEVEVDFLQRVEDGEAGQAAITLLLVLGLFLLGCMGFGVDFTNIMFHRQTARSAADAACQAAAMDMIVGQASSQSATSGFTPGTAGNCASSPSATMCTYASVNGYNGTGLVANTASNSVSWTFPSSVTGATATAANSFLQVNISEYVRTYFMSMVNASRYQTVNASCTCGTVQVKAAPPMVVLHPTKSGSFYYSGGGALYIVGGPKRGLQVNSSNSTAVQWVASGVMDLSKGGPSQTGSDLGIVGGPTTIPTNGSSTGFAGGTMGTWKSNVLAVPDPFGSVATPVSVKTVSPQYGTSGRWVAYGVDGCPDQVNRAGQTNSYCREFAPGYYPSGLTLPNNYSTIIFMPGVYYLNGSLVAGGSNTLRVAKPSGYQQTDGIMFFFLSGSLDFSGCTGCNNSGNSIDNVATTNLTCDGSSPPTALGMPTTIGGNVLWGQCTSSGTYFDSGGDTTDARSSAGARGILVFQDHANTTQPSFTGSGQLVFSGALYFHSSTYSDVLSLNGGSSSGTYVLGQIITDQVNLTGSGTIRLALNPIATTEMAKVAILQ